MFQIAAIQKKSDEMIEEIDIYISVTEAETDKFSAEVFEATEKMDNMRLSLHEFLQVSPDHQLVREYRDKFVEAEKLLSTTWERVEIPQFNKLVCQTGDQLTCYPSKLGQ